MDFKNRLQKGETLLGTLLGLPSPEIAEILSSVGYDWLFIDLEHGAHGMLEAQRMLQAMHPNCAALVRVPELTESHIKKALDIGSTGIIVPKVNTKEEAEKAVAWAKYPPQGDRGVGPARAHGYGYHFSNYLETANEKTLVVIQIEHIEGVNNIDSILEVKGVDAIFIGPFDLSASLHLMGQVDHPKVIEAISKVEAACAKVNMPMGYFGMKPESVIAYKKKGYQLIACGTDAGALIAQSQSVLEELK